MKSHLYLAGPMTDVPAFNHPAFHAAAAELRAAGYQVTNPAENDLPPGAPWLDHMRVDIKALMDCDAVAVLDGWHLSRGANAEINLATQLGIEVHATWWWLARAGVEARQALGMTGCAGSAIDPIEEHTT